MPDRKNGKKPPAAPPGPEYGSEDDRSRDFISPAFLASEVKDLTTFFENNNFSDAAVILTSLLQQVPLFLTMAANPRNYGDDERLAIAGTVLIATRNPDYFSSTHIKQISATDIPGAVLNILNGIVKVDDPDRTGKKRLTSNAKVLAYYLEALQRHKDMTGTDSRPSVEECVAQIRATPGIEMKDVLACEPFRKKPAPRASTAPPAPAQDIKPWVMATFTQRLPRRKFKELAAINRAARGYNFAKQYGDARKLFEAWLRKYPFLSGGPLGTYAHTLVETGNPEAAHELLAPHVRPEGAVYKNAFVQLVYCEALIRSGRQQEVKPHLDALFSDSLFIQHQQDRNIMTALRRLWGHDAGGGAARRDPQSRAIPGTLLCG